MGAAGRRCHDRPAALPTSLEQHLPAVFGISVRSCCQHRVARPDAVRRPAVEMQTARRRFVDTAGSQSFQQRQVSQPFSCFPDLAQQVTGTALGFEHEHAAGHLAADDADAVRLAGPDIRPDLIERQRWQVPVFDTPPAVAVLPCFRVRLPTSWMRHPRQLPRLIGGRERVGLDVRAAVPDGDGVFRPVDL